MEGGESKAVYGTDSEIATSQEGPSGSAVGAWRVGVVGAVRIVCEGGKLSAVGADVCLPHSPGLLGASACLSGSVCGAIFRSCGRPPPEAVPTGEEANVGSLSGDSTRSVGQEMLLESRWPLTLAGAGPSSFCLRCGLWNLLRLDRVTELAFFLLESHPSRSPEQGRGCPLVPAGSDHLIGRDAERDREEAAITD